MRQIAPRCEVDVTPMPQGSVGNPPTPKGDETRENTLTCEMAPHPERHTAQKESEPRIQLEVGAEARLCDSDRSRMVETLGSIYDSTAAEPHRHDNQKNLVTLQND